MVDIIIPVYNSAKTVEKALESVASQISALDIKVYIIDDGSKDEYFNIINKYENILNITYHKYEKNRGPGFARNIGVELSNGEFIIFLDSDDKFYDNDSLKILYESIISTNADVVRSIVVEETNNGNKEYVNENIGLHGKIYRRKFLSDNSIKFLDGYSNEDTSFNAIIKMCGALYKDIDKRTYLWCNNKVSLTRSNENQASYDLQNLVYNMYYALEVAVRKNCNINNILESASDFLIDVFNRRRDINNMNKHIIDDYVHKIYNVFLKLSNIDLLSYIDNKYSFDDEEYKKRLFDYLNNIIINHHIINTQEERMKNRLLYQPLDDELGDERAKYIKLMLEYNKTVPFDYTQEKDMLLRKILGSVKSCIIEPPFYATWGGKNIYVGANVYIDYNVIFVDDGIINIGNNVFIGPGAKIFTINHSLNPLLRKNNYLSVKDVNIKDGAFIGGGSIILPGVTIGENSIIGAGSVVSCDIPANVIAVGNPCKVIRNISEKDEIFYDKDKIIDWENILY